MTGAIPVIPIGVMHRLINEADKWARAQAYWPAMTEALVQVAARNRLNYLMSAWLTGVHETTLVDKT